MPRPLAPHLPARQPPQFAMDDGQKLLQGRLVAIGPASQQPRDVVATPVWH